jgi:hypothetical protein
VIELDLKLETFMQTCQKFRVAEGRASYYDIALEIVNDHPFQAVLIILATWNVARWRFMASGGENIAELRNAIDKSEPLLNQLKADEFQTVNFDNIEPEVKALYEMFAKIKGVEYTGATKVLHLLHPRLFVMWDAPIREQYKVGTSSDGYFQFLKEMQTHFNHLGWSSSDRTFAKAIDEYNQATITLPKNEKKYMKSYL